MALRFRAWSHRACGNVWPPCRRSWLPVRGRPERARWRGISYRFDAASSLSTTSTSWIPRAATDRERAIWFDGYVRTYVERDLQALSSISALPDFRRLMQAAALRVGQILNQTQLGRDVALPQPTAHRYLNLLETSYMLVRLPAYAMNRTKRIIKSPKLYWTDTGLALHLGGETEPRGAHLENLVLQDLLAWRDSRLERASLLYWRTTVDEEIDFVIETTGRLLPIGGEVGHPPPSR